ncbi:XrtA system polysaccharide chain length determinant [Propionivibrio soli]|jgi:polysaccharide chain length determinant protein (PEP-CTERM system associated)|uniref:XrtA system polysaccharide chain length determinant n=1 Tax=Propionivibrio soli TaxID=2976531 RepID=UPI0021E96E0D|nr:XrtA system polysaccharide chain length determinant [Propionivibrio soli]
MDEIIRQATTILRGMWKHRWLGIVVAWLVAAIGVVTVLRIPDKYEASTRIYVDTQSILKPLMSGLAIEPNLDQQIMILSRTLISRPNIEKLIRMADLDLNIKSKQGQDALIDSLMKTLTIKSTSRDNLYTLSYNDQDPERAKRVVQSLASIFVESSLGDKRKDTDSAKKFIDDQIIVYQKKLEEAENRLKEFKLRNISMQTSDGKDYFGRIGEVSAALERSKLELREAENARDSLKRQIVGEEPVLLPDNPNANANAAVSLPEIDGRIDAMKRNLDGLLQRYTEQHPDVVGTRRMIHELEEQKRQEIASRKKIDPASPASLLNNNPVYQQLKLALAENEATVASLRVRVAEYQARYNQLKDAMKLVPQLEAEYSQLNRDYDINKRNYESLVSRRESATLSGEMEASAGGVDFRLIDPPRVSPRPVSPNRLLLVPLTLVLALAAGFFVAFAASQIRPVFFDARALRELTGLPLLGSVSRRADDAARTKEKRDFRRFIAASASLVCAYGAGIAVLFLISIRTA